MSENFNNDKYQWIKVSKNLAEVLANYSATFGLEDEDEEALKSFIELCKNNGLEKEIPKKIFNIIRDPFIKATDDISVNLKSWSGIIIFEGIKTFPVPRDYIDAGVNLESVYDLNLLKKIKNSPRLNGIAIQSKEFRRKSDSAVLKSGDSLDGTEVFLTATVEKILKVTSNNSIEVNSKSEINNVVFEQLKEIPQENWKITYLNIMEKEFEE